MKRYFVYILSSQKFGTLYTGVTSNLVKRVYEHENKIIKGFSSKYECDSLVYYEIFQDINEAIKREKQIKAGSRKKKVELIKSFNRFWKDLYSEICRY